MSRSFLLLLPILLVSACPPGSVYESVFNKCYQFFDSPTSFLSAEKKCESIGGNLVSIQNAFENSYVSGLVGGSNFDSSYWIGANLLESSNWTWTSSAAFLFSDWAPNQPADPTINQCAAARVIDHMWTKEMCSSSRPFVCAINPDTFPQACPTQQPNDQPVNYCYGRCHYGYTQYYGDCNCYSYYPYPLATYNDSVDYCTNHGGRLAVIKTWDLANWLANFVIQSLDSSTGHTYWPRIGLYCSEKDQSSCNWIDGTNLLSGYNNLDQMGSTAGHAVVLNANEIYFGYWERSDLTAGALCQEKSQ